VAVDRGAFSTIPTILRCNLPSSSLAATSREVGYSGMGLEPIDNITYGRNKNIKVSGD
jgi:hypothetical protein